MFLPLAIFNINFMSSNLLLLVSVLVFISLLVNKVGARFGVPTLLLFLLSACSPDGTDWASIWKTTK